MKAKKTGKLTMKPMPVVVGGRYCLKCTRLVLAVTLELDRPLLPRCIGTVRSGCCMAETALVLWPAQADQNFPIPPRLTLGVTALSSPSRAPEPDHA